MNRESSWEQIDQHTWDVVVIGGGATGLGIALDAQTRGYRTLLVEKNDFCSGTSSKSTKLVHGGLRYLKQGNISLVKEALAERNLLFKNAPHLVRPLEFVIPTYSLFESYFYQAGLTAYDLLATSSNLPRSHRVGRHEFGEDFPQVKQESLVAGMSYFDGQFDDARLAISLVKKAHKAGAVLINYVSLESFEKTNGRLSSAMVHDTLTGQTSQLSAKVFVNATGVFSSTVQELSQKRAKYKISPSKGTHIVFPKEVLCLKKALMIPKTSDGRVLFAVPWYEHTLVGTTDIAVPVAVERPVPSRDEIDYLLEICNQYFEFEVRRDQITSCFTGLRPLVEQSNKSNSKDVDRKHLIDINEAGLVSVIGGKWTTYRKMAEDCLDEIGRNGFLDAKTCITESLSLDVQEVNENDLMIFKEFHPADGIVHPSLPYLWKDIYRAIALEMGQTIEDVLARRTRALFLDARASVEIAESVAAALAFFLNKDEAWKDAECDRFKAIAQEFIPTL